MFGRTPYCTFDGNIDGYVPLAGAISDEAGALYGTASEGPGTGGGTVYKLSPPLNTGRAWTATVLHIFTGADGIQPYVGSLIFDELGALYGTTNVGGAYNHGTAFKLTPPTTSDGLWTETVLHSFAGGVSQGNTGVADGSQPLGGLIFDKSGALYGTTVSGGEGATNGGTVFKLTPPSTVGGVWTETVLHSFIGVEGVEPPAGLIFDRSGALYGTTQSGALGYGTVFKLTPPAKADRIWTLTVLHSFTQSEGSPSYGDLVFGKSGALYGATLFGGTFEHGTVFKLTPPGKPEGVWTETILHSFTGDDGANPYDGLILDKSGTLYGTTNQGGAHGYGTVFKLAEEMGFAGTPGKANCDRESVSVLVRQYGGLNAAAAALGYASVQAMQEAIMEYCEG